MKKYLKINGLLFIILLSLFQLSCKYNDVLIGDIKDFKLGKIESKNISVKISVPVTNPNNYKITITKYNLTVIINKQKFELVETNKNIVIPKQYKGDLSIPVVLKTSGVLNFQTLRTIYKIFSQKKIDVDTSGTIKVRVLIISKKIKIDEKRTIYIK